jgi:hypothetical protein
MPEARCSTTSTRRTRTKKDAVGNASPTTDPKGKVRRGRKSKNVVNAYNMQSMVKHDEDDELHDAAASAIGSMHDENLIIHLNIKKDWSAVVSDAGMTPAFPNAYNGYADNAFQSVPMDYPEDGHAARASKGASFMSSACDPTVVASTKRKGVSAATSASASASLPAAASNTPAPKAHLEHEQEDQGLRVVDLLKDFEVKSKNAEWPATTSISCYWCCHPFANVPFGMPVKYTGGKFHVCGCFCSLECVTAFNFASNESQSEKWERYNLTNLLSRLIGHSDRVKPAPSRLTLKMFGGHMDVDEFRMFFTTSKILNINFPPMMTLTQQIEELNECDVSSEYKYIPLDIDRINRYKEKMTLKRTKPVTDYRNTLDCMMNLKIQ